MVGAALVLGAVTVLLWQPWRAQVAETADVTAGRSLAQACTVCHALEMGAPPRVGPHLWQIVGRPVADVEGFGYSRALVRADGVWTVERLDRFLADPEADFPGNAMIYAGMADPDDRARLIAFLRTLAD